MLRRSLASVIAIALSAVGISADPNSVLAVFPSWSPDRTISFYVASQHFGPCGKTDVATEFSTALSEWRQTPGARLARVLPGTPPIQDSFFTSQQSFNARLRPQ